MDRLLGKLVSRGLRRGIRGEPLWLAVGVGAWLWRRARNTTPRTIWTGRVEPGKQLLVTMLDPGAENMTERA